VRNKNNFVVISFCIVKLKQFCARILFWRSSLEDVYWRFFIPFF